MITSRTNHQFNWLVDSLVKGGGFDGHIMLIDLNRDDSEELSLNCDLPFTSSQPKPNIWQGPYRKTPVDWWAKSNAINTALCLTKHEWIMFVDDRCVVVPGFMDAVREAMDKRYIMAGSYEKRIGLRVDDGYIIDMGELMAKDHRWGSDTEPNPAGGEWLFGCCTLAPLEWWLSINGAPEKCDGLSFEDVITGFLFQNKRYPIRYDRRAKIIEDRSPEHIGTTLKRSSKELHPHDTSDKAHKLLNWVRGGAEQSENGFDIRALRDSIQNGGEFPKPEDRDYHDWFDNENLKEMK